MICSCLCLKIGKRNELYILRFNCFFDGWLSQDIQFPGALEVVDRFLGKGIIHITGVTKNTSGLRGLNCSTNAGTCLYVSSNSGDTEVNGERMAQPYSLASSNIP